MATVSPVEAKTRAARAAVATVHRGEILAVGSGSTVELALAEIAQTVPAGSRPTIVAASRRAEEVARNLGIPTASLEQVEGFRLMIDGADEVTPQLTLLKGGGGAHFREKILARMSQELSIMADYTKLVRRIGEVAPLPLEVVPFALPYVTRKLDRMHLRPVLRQQARGPAAEPSVTDNGNRIIDCRVTAEAGEEAELEDQLGRIPGVVATGLFVNLARTVYVGMPDGRVEILRAGEGLSASVIEEAVTARRALAKMTI